MRAKKSDIALRDARTLALTRLSHDRVQHALRTYPYCVLLDCADGVEVLGVDREFFKRGLRHESKLHRQIARKFGALIQTTKLDRAVFFVERSAKVDGFIFVPETVLLSGIVDLRCLNVGDVTRGGERAEACLRCGAVSAPFWVINRHPPQPGDRYMPARLGYAHVVDVGGGGVLEACVLDRGGTA